MNLTWPKAAAAAVAIVLAGCATPPAQVPAPAAVHTNPEQAARDAEAVGDFGAAARAWQALAAKSASPAREAYQLNSAAAWLAAGEATSSLALLSQIDVALLGDELIARKQVLLARLALGRGDVNAAAAALQPTYSLALPAALVAERDAVQAQLPPGTSLKATRRSNGGDFVAVLLPYGGALDRVAKAITDGVVAARMQDAAGPVLQFYPTGEDVVAVYQKAIADGAQVVIGPLQKAEVAALAANPLPRPTLALNSPDPPVAQVNLFRLSLDPADEATAGARWLVGAGYGEVAMLYADDAWGKRQRDLYSAALAAQGGRVRAAVAFKGGATDFAASLRTLFADRLALADIAPVVGQVPPSELASPGPQALIIIANAADARQIVPAVAYVGLGELPLLTTSQVWGGSANASADADLDGLVFCDSPWSLTRTTASGAHGPLAAALSLAPQLDRQPPRLLALGADAYRIAAQLRLGQSVDSLPDGATGALKLEPDGAFHRDGLSCARFSGGAPTLLPP